MENFEIEPKFTETMRKLKTSDPAHAELFNDLIGALLNNDVFIKNIVEQLQQQFRQHMSDMQTTLDTYYQQATGYADQKIADLINGAPTTRDTLNKIAKAMEENADVVEALNAAIGTKANQAEMESLLSTKLDKESMGGFTLYPEELTKEEYDVLQSDIKNTPKKIFIMK